LEFVVVATKADKCSQQELQKSLRDIKEQFGLESNQPIPVSSLQGIGKKEIWKGIRQGILSLENGEDYDSEGNDDDSEGNDDDSEGNHDATNKAES